MYKLTLFVAIVIAVISKIAANKPIPTNIEKKDFSAYPKDVNYRLPNTSYPEKYNIVLTWIDDEKFTFDGIVSIEIVIRSDTKTIVIHKNNDVKKVTLKLSGGTAKEVPYSYSNITDFLTITNNDIMTARSRYTLEITYSGVLRTTTHGFFRQSYIAENGEKRQEAKIFAFSFLCVICATSNENSDYF